MRRLGPFAAIVMGWTLAAGPADAAGPQAKARATMDRQVQADHDADRPQRVIVRHRPGTGDTLRARLEARGNRVKGHQRGSGALVVSLGAGQLRAWAGDADVLGLSVDARVRPTDSTDVWRLVGSSDPPFDAQHLRRTLGLSAAPSGGTGVGVAIIDSGIAPVLDLASRIIAFRDFTRGGVAAWPSDAYGHGTHVAGLIAGSGLLSGGRYAGIAPRVRLIGLKVLDAEGSGYASDVVAALDFAVANRKRLGIDVINLSLGHPVLEPAATDPLVQAVERASAAGIVVVASAGNFGRNDATGIVGFGGIASPGNAPSALTVGALQTHGTEDRGDDTVAAFSSRGPTWYDAALKPDILAPGCDLIAVSNPRSALAKRRAFNAGVFSHLKLSGTSMAAAVATGVVALVIETSREHAETPGARLTPNAVKALLQYSAIEVTPHDAAATGPLEHGAGGLNAAGALALAASVEPTVPTGRHWLDVGVSPVSTIGEAEWPWGRRISWGDRLIWGESIARHEPAWDAITWGSPVTWAGDLLVEPSLVMDSVSLWSAQVVWGPGRVAILDDDHIVWGDSDDGFDHIVWGNAPDEAPAAVVPSIPGR